MGGEREKNKTKSLSSPIALSGKEEEE